MSNIAEVISWKFNNQSGMATKDGVITAFPGGIPSAQDQATWTAEYEAYLPLKAWGESMASSDNVLPRWAEDLYDALPLEIRDVVNPVTKNKMIQKKAQRAMKPSA